MLEEKNDNLQQADGNTETPNNQATGNETPELNPVNEPAPPAFVAEQDTVQEEANVTEGAIPATEASETLTEETADTEVENPETAESHTEVTEEEIPAAETSFESVPEGTSAQTAAPQEDKAEISAATPETTTTEQAVEAIAESNAEEGEDETLAGRHEIEMPDYEALSMEQQVAELEKLVSVEKVMSVKEHVEQLRTAFLSKYNNFIDEKKEQFLAENPDTTEEFEYHFPLKQQFDLLYNVYREKKNRHFKELQNNLQDNLATRLAIVEELKELINPQENIKDTLKHFNELRERWKNAGAIPKDKYNHVWNNYHFHVENFYDYLHLDREARDGDFRNNLEQKERIIARAEQLLEETDIAKAFRELQDLHKIWKEDIGPVSQEHRENVWNRFSEITKKMHDKRESLYESFRAKENENLEKKKALIAQIEVLAADKQSAHSSWQKQVEKVEALRNEFFATGKVPSEVNEQTWTEFKTAVRNFNAVKNSFYKDIKKEQNDNLNKKLALVARANELKETEDFAGTTPAMKQIQEEWKMIGHVPRKYSDKIWKDFKDACNHYFERLKANRSEANSEELEAFEKKKAYIETVKEFEFSGDHKTDLDGIKAIIEQWKTLGKVPFSRKHIDGKFNKVLDGLFEKLTLSKKDSDMMRFSNRIDQLSGSNDTRKLDNEKIFLIRKIEETQSEIFQLENNIQFFSSKNAKKENPMVAEVRKSIERHKDELVTLKEKLKQLRSLKQE